MIDVQVSRLRRKIGTASATPLIHTVRGAGYTLSDQQGPGNMDLDKSMTLLPGGACGTRYPFA